MKRTTAKIVSISDLIQWNEKNEIELSPKYQRNSVWNEKAKSYLIDTIIRGLPIPPIFMRQQVDVTTKSTRREIIDGQQRIRAILEYIVSEAYAIKKSHNKAYGGKKYSDLNEETREAILEYEIVAEVVTEKDESVIYDMFARLNSNNYILNDQEIRNSKYWGEFKVLVYRLSSKYRDFFLNTKLLSDNDCARMRDSELINSLLIVLIDGIVKETPKYVEGIYRRLDSTFEEADTIECECVAAMKIIQGIYEYLNGNFGCFQNKNYFYTLYCVIVNQMFGLKNFEIDLVRLPEFSNPTIFNNTTLLYNAISCFIAEFDAKIQDKNREYNDSAEYETFVLNHKTRTTGKLERMKRVAFLNNALGRIAKDVED